MTSRQRGNYPRRFSTLLAVGLAVVSILVLLPWLAFGSSRVSQVFLGSRRWFERLTPDRSPATVIERDRLRQQLATVTTRLAETERQLDTVKTSSELQGYITDRQLRSIVTTITAYSPDPGIQSIVLQSGAVNGLQPGLAVVTEEGLLVGLIERVHQRTATALLLTDPQIRVLAKARNQAQSRGIVRGYQGLGLQMDFIPKSDRLESGQVVVTSGLDPKIPPDLVIGTVEMVTAQPGELFQQARIISPAGFNQLNVVAVILPNL